MMKYYDSIVYPLWMRFRNVAFYSASTSTAQLFMFINALLLARVLGPAMYGVYVGAYAFATITSFIFTWGQDTWMLRTAAMDYSVKSVSGAILKTKFLLGVVWAISVIVITPYIKPDFFPTLLPAVCVADVWLDSALTTLIGALNVQRRLKGASFLIMASRSMRLLGTVYLILVGGSSPLLYAALRLMFTIISFFLGLIVFRPGWQDLKVDWGLSLIKKTTPYGLSELLALVYVQADISMMTLLAGEKNTGIYSAASGLVGALFVLPNTGYTLAIPWLSRIKQSRQRILQNPLIKTLIGFSVLGVLLWGVVFFLGRVMVSLFLGGAYAQTGEIVVLLSPIIGLKSIEFGLAAGIIAIGWQKKRLWPQLISAVINIVFNLWAIPRFGGAGAAGVYVGSELVLALGYGLIMVRWFQPGSLKGSEV